jgi:hypothetical protein
MGLQMDLIAGDAREILLLISLEHWEAFDDRSRFQAHLALGSGLDPDWFDAFAAAARKVLHQDSPESLTDACSTMVGPEEGDRVVERVDPAWVEAVARIPEQELDHIAGAWIEILAGEHGELSREDKSWLRYLTGELVTFARAARPAEDVLFAWGF